MKPTDPNTIRELFREYGIRCTRQREAVYRTLAMCSSHPTAEELFQLVRVDEPGVSLATIYNTLEMLVEERLCQRLSPLHGGAGGPSRYDADTSEHIHIVEPDGSMRDVPEEVGRAVMSSLTRETLDRVGAELGVRIDRVNVEFVVSDPSDPPESPERNDSAQSG